jgi:hypothetical protein
MFRRPTVAAVAVAAGIAGASLAALGWRERVRARHLALPVLADPSAGAPAGVPLPEGPPCATEEVSRAGARVTALLEAGDGELWIGTFDRGLLRGGAPGFPAEAVPGLAGRQLFVNALLEHDGLVWAATQGGLLAFDGSRRALALLEREAVTALAAVRGALYAATARGLHRVTVGGGAERVDAAGPAGEPLRPTALAASGDRLWIGTASGVYALSLRSLDAPLLARTASWHPLVFGEPGAETNVVTALAPLDGGVVAGTDDGGLVLVRADGRVAATRFADARANEVNPGAAAVAPGGAVLAGTQGGGALVARTGAAGLDVLRAGGRVPLEISAVAPAAGGALLGVADGAVVRIACGAVPAS